MKTTAAPVNRIADVNLSTGFSTRFAVSRQDRRQYLGGKGLGLKLLQERLKGGIDPLGAENILAVITGALTGTGLPCTGGFSAITKSPLTGLMMHSSCAGAFGTQCRTAGYDGLLVSGRAPEPVILRIDATGVHTEDGSELWGLDTRETQERLNSNGTDAVLTIGPAGENRVLFANAAAGECHFGSGGLGAVMGAKNLKAIVVRGNTCRVHPARPDRFLKHRKKMFAFLKQSPIGGSDSGHRCSESHIHGLDTDRSLPINNFRQGSRYSDDQVAVAPLLTRFPFCPMTCTCDFMRSGQHGPFQAGKIDFQPDYAQIAMLGTNLGILDPDRIAAFADCCNRFGLDSVSTGSVLAWCMEAGQIGLIDTRLRFGSPTGVETAIADIACRRGFGDEMADGTRNLARRYGGAAFAIQVKGQDLPPHDPRDAWGLGLAFAVDHPGNWHGAAAMVLLENNMGFLKPHSTRAKAHWVKFFEDVYAAVDSLHICPSAVFAWLFGSPLVKHAPEWLLRTIAGYLPSVATRLLNVSLFARLWHSITGIKLDRRQMLEAGARVHVLERSLNAKAGVSRKDDCLPERFVDAGQPDDDEPHAVPLQPMLDAYYRLRGFDLRGIPETSLLKRLDIAGAPSPAADLQFSGFKMISPGLHRMKRLYLLITLWFVGRAVEAACKVDRPVRRLFDAIPDGLTFALNIAPHGPAMVLTKDKRGRVRYLDGNVDGRYIDLTMTIKSVDMAFSLFTFQEAIVTAIARDRLVVAGDVSTACTVVRILERVEVCLLPKALACLCVRRYPKLSLLRWSVGRGLIVLRALVGI